MRKALVLLTLVLLTPGLAFGAISVGNTSNSVTAGADGTAVSSLAWNHTVAAGDNRALAVIIGCTDDITGGIGTASCTFNGDSMTLLRSQATADGGGTDAQMDIFYMVAPDVATGSVSCTLNGANKIVMGAAVNFTGVDQTTPIDQGEATGDSNTNTNAATMAVTLTTGSAYSVYVYGLQYKVDTGTPATAGGETEVTNTTLTDATNSGDFVMGYKAATTAGNYTVTYTGGPADDGVIGIFGFRETARRIIT